MVDHPVRWILFLLVVYIALNSAFYTRRLFGAYRTLQRASVPDELAVLASYQRFKLVRWLAAAECLFVIWGSVVVSIDTAVTWRTIVGFCAVFGGQLTIAWGIRNSNRDDKRFADHLAGKPLFFCSDLGCPYRADRENLAPIAPWRKKRR